MTDQVPSGPDFAPPSRQQQPERPDQRNQLGWTPQQTGEPAFPPSVPAPSPGRPRRRGRWPLALGLAVVVAGVGAGALFAPSLATRPAATPTNGSTAVPLVTVSPAPQPTAQTALTSGGDLQAPATFTSSSGTGTLTISQATWTHTGRMAPPDGMAYLIVEATVSCVSGELDVSSLSLRTTAQPAEQSAFGADLSDQFPGVRLSAGEQQSGQVGFVLPAGTVTLSLLDQATLQPVASRVVPGP